MSQGRSGWRITRVILGACLAFPVVADVRVAVWQCEELPEGAVTCRRVVVDAPLASVSSIDLVLSYTPVEAEVGSLRKTGLADSLWLAQNTATAGTIRVGLAGATPTGGEGDLLLIPFLDTPEVVVRIESVLVNEGGLGAAIVANTAPVLETVADPILEHGGSLDLMLSASDADLPAQPLRFSLTAGPAGMAVDPLTGILSWEPGMEQRAGLHPVTVKVTDAGEPPLADALTFDVRLHASVVARHLFYNQSFWDGNDPAANAADDGAIAPDKTALLPGGRATFANYSSYSRGLNGLMVDIAGLPGVPTADDFSFSKGNDATPEDWESAPLPLMVAVRTGAGTSGSDRVTLIWGSDSIRNAWIEVTTLVTEATGLRDGRADVFYFGSAVGECGNSPGDAIVDISDVLRPFNNQSGGNSVPISLNFDFNRDAYVDISDVLLPFNNQTGAGRPLSLIDLAGAEASATTAGEDLPPSSVPRMTGIGFLESGAFAVLCRPLVVDGSAALRLVILPPDGAVDWELQVTHTLGKAGWGTVAGAVGPTPAGHGWMVDVQPSAPARFFRLRSANSRPDPFEPDTP